MALRLPAFGERVHYVLRADRASDVPTVFVLRRLTGAEKTQVAALTPVAPRAAAEVHAISQRALEEARELTAEESARVEQLVPVDGAFLAQRHAQLRLAARLGVAEIRNLLADDGTPSKMPPAEFVEMAEPAWVAELGEEVLALSGLSEATRKNSPAPPGPGA